MKKIYFLLITLTITSLSFGQVIVADGFSYSDGSLVPNGGWTTGSGNAGDLLVASGEAVVQHGTPSEDARRSFSSVAGDIYYALDFSVDDLGAPYAGTDNEYFSHVNFRARLSVGPGTNGGDYTVGIGSSSAGQAIWGTDLTYGQTYRAVVRYNQDLGVAELWIDPVDSGSTSISGTEDGATSIDSFDLRQSDSSENETVRVDDLMIGQTFDDVLVFAASVDPTLIITTPSEGTVFAPGTTNVTISIDVTNFNVGNGTGDGHIRQVLTTPGGTFDEFKYDTADQNVSVADGESYSIFMELVDNANNPIAPAVQMTVNFSVGSLSQVATIADLRAGTLGNNYELSNEAIISYIVTDNTRNQKYIQDATGGILIDDTAGTLSTVFNIGDGITGLQGQLNEFSGVLQFVPSANVATASSTGNTITPEDVSVVDYLANGENYESELIRITNVTFGVTGVFENNTNYDITDGADATIARVSFADENLIGANIPTMASSVIGLGAEFNGTYQVLPRYVSDVAGASLSIDEVNNSLFSIYPNPTSTGYVNITSTNNNDITTVAVYDILGKQVINSTLNNNRLNVSSLNSGVYILKISQNSASVTKKLVIK